MKGCRGDERELERKIWAAVRKNRADPKPSPGPSLADIAAAGELRARADRLADLAEDLARHLRALHKWVKVLRSRADELVDPLPVDSPAVQPAVAGVITKADNDENVFVIDLGKADGVKPDATYIVHRGDRYVATIRIREVRQTESTGFALEGLSKAAIEVGDRLMDAR